MRVWFKMNNPSFPTKVCLRHCSAKKHNHKIAIVLVIFAVSSMSIADSIYKYLIHDYHPLQIMWSRYFFFFIPVLLAVRGRWVCLLKTNRLFLQIGRALLAFAAGVLTVISLKYISLAETTAILFTYPLMVIILSIPVFGEQIDLKMLMTVAVGFLGIVIIVNPDNKGINLTIIFPIIAAFFSAIFQITTKILTESESSKSTLMYTGIVGIIITSIPMPMVWRTPQLLDWILMVGLGLCYCFAIYCWIRALEISTASILSPFIYSKIVAATVFGFLIFDEIPSLQTVVGAILIVGSGLYAFHKTSSYSNLANPDTTVKS